MKRSLCLAFLGLCVGSHVYANTLCVDPSDSGCFSTIQAAVNAASPGDVIEVFPNPDSRGYRENVVVNTANLRIVGMRSADLALKGLTKEMGGLDLKTHSGDHCSNVILDACETTTNPTSCGGDGFTLNASGITIRNFTIRHTDVAIQLNSANESKVIDSCVIDSADGVLGTANRSKVFDSKFVGIRIGAGIDFDGDNNIANRNALINTDGLRLDGQNNRITGNYIDITTDRDCIGINGDNGAILDNKLLSCDSDAIGYRGNSGIIRGNQVNGCEDGGVDYTGDNGEITDNVIKYCVNGEGIEYRGNNAKITANTVISIADDSSGISASGDSLEISYNDVLVSSDNGIDLSGNSSSIHHNQVVASGADSDEPGIEISGSDNSISYNFVKKNTFAGISNSSGDRNTYFRNTAIVNGRSGIRIQNGDSNVINQNETLNNHGEGINNGSGATNTVITDNRSLGNRTDVCNSGTVATFNGNIFDTGGITTPCVVETIH